MGCSNVFTRFLRVPADSSLRVLHCVWREFGGFLLLCFKNETRIKSDAVPFPCPITNCLKETWQSFCSSKAGTFS